MHSIVAAAASQTIVWLAVLVIVAELEDTEYY
jgi:hypothetical protein